MINFIINTILYVILFLFIKKVFNINLKKTNILKIGSIFLSLLISNIIYFFLKEQDTNFYLLSFFLNISIITILKGLITKFNDDKEINFKNLIHYIFIAITISFILELSIFNFRFYQSLSYEESTLKTQLNDERIQTNGNTFTVSESGDYTFEYLNINQEIKNIKIDIKNINKKNQVFDVQISATDEANEVYLELPKITVANAIARSQYHQLQLSGKSEKIKLTIYLEKGKTYAIDEIAINVNRPLFIQLIRITLVSLIIFLYYIFRPSSKIYKIKLLEHKGRFIAISLLIIGEIALCSFIFCTNTLYKKDKYYYHHQYHSLAKAFTKGQLNLEIPVSKKLKDLNNPYDYQLRRSEKLVSGKDYYWDHAYYNGKYYVYFGVLPVLTAHLPYYLLTGKELLNHQVFLVVGILTIISFIFLLYQIVKKWFKNTSLGLFLILATLLLNASGLLLAFKNHDLYILPIIYSLFLSSTGLSFWISAYNNDKNNLSIPKLALGSLCLALIAACRPQFLLSSFFIFPLFFNYFFKEGKITKRKIKELIALLFPYILVAIPLMLYNYFRFGSVFDFGANYNLTTNDMTKRGFSFERTFPGLYYYLIDMPNIKPIYPFLETEKVITNYLGKTISEKMCGGFLISNIICLVSFLSFKMKKQFEDKKLFYISTLSIIFAFIIIIADTQMAGILPRYLLDFSWLFLLSTIIVILTLNERIKNKELLLKIIIILVSCSVIYAILASINEGTYVFAKITPLMYEYIKYLISFWL